MKEIIYSTDKFDVIEKDDQIGIEPNGVMVMVMPFTTDQRGLPLEIGVLNEFNEFRKGNYTNTLITGMSEDEDPDVLSTAQRELNDMAGYDVPESERWYFLGFITGSKMVQQEIPCFACNITGLTPKVKETEEDVNPEDKVATTNVSKFMLIPANDALETDDCFVPTLFMRVFRYIFGYGKDAEAVKSDDIKSEETNTTK